MGNKGTIIVLPLKDKRKNHALIAKQLKKISASLLLCLNHLERFIVNGEESRIRRVSSNLFGVKDGDGEPTLWKSYHITLPIPPNMRKFLGEDRGIKDIEKRVKEKEKIVLTFEVAEDGKVKPNQTGKIYAFLPTEIRTNFMFNIQADFSVNLERTAFRATGEKWNQWVLSNVYKCIPLIIQDYKSRKINRTEFYKILPLEDPERPRRQGANMWLNGILQQQEK